MKLRFFSKLFLFLNFFVFCRAEAQDLKWAFELGGAFTENVKNIDIDSIGNIYVTGNIINNIDFDPSNNTIYPNAVGPFIAKYDEMGNYDWVFVIRPLSSSGSFLSINDISVNNHEILIGGEFKESYDFDPDTSNFILQSSSRDAFVAKYNLNGELIWAKKFGGNGTDRILCISVDSLGNSYTTGTFTDTVDFDPDTSTNILIPYNSPDIFFSKFDANGKFEWVKQISGVDLRPTGLAISKQNDFGILTGHFADSILFNGNQNVFQGLSAANIFFAKFDLSGTFHWCKKIEGTFVSEPTIDIDNSKNIFIGGLFGGTIDLDPSVSSLNLTASGSYADGFLSKYDSNGDLLWANQIGGSLRDEIHSLIIDSSGNIYVVGHFTGMVDFDPSVNSSILNSSNGGNFFFAKYDSAGNLRYSKNIEGISNPEMQSITIDKYSNIYVVGTFEDTADFNPGLDSLIFIARNDNPDIFIGKYGCIDSYIKTDLISPSFCENDTAIFQIEAGGTGLFYQWQVDDGTGFQNIQSSDSSFILSKNYLKIVPSISSYDGNQFRCLINSDCGKPDTSSIGILSLNYLPESNFNYSINGSTIYFTNLSTGASSFFWDFGDSTSDNSINPIHVYSSARNYTVRLSAYNSCGTNSLQEDILISGLDSLESKVWFKAYPNPVEKLMTVGFSGLFSPIEITIKDLIGRSKFVSQYFYDGIYQIDLSDFAKGAYILEMKNAANESSYYKFIH